MIQNGSQTVNFIYTTNPVLVTTARRVILTAAATPMAIAAATATEVNNGFAGALSPTSVANVVRLGEQAAVIPAGTAQVRASVSVGTTSLVLAGVSGGAIAVPFIPTDLFTPAASAASLNTAIGSSPLASSASSPGGGTLLFSSTRLIQLQRNGGLISTAGINLPAITDLAENPIASTRDDGETRFTIIMPEVQFDFGDAPISYGTLFANNGARHSVGSTASPRLGRIIDTELNGQPAPGGSDDVAVAIAATSPGSSPLFSFSSPGLGARDVTVNDITPTSGSRLQISISGVVTTFELVTTGIAPALNNIPVPFIEASGPIAGDLPNDIARRFADAIRSELANAGGSLTVTIDPSTPTVIELRTVDDEDGLSIGTFGGRTVFLIPGASTPTDDAADVLGFLNPQDPLGSNVSVTVTGNGLLDAWIDFNKSGTFDTDEQVLKNAPVVDGVNTLRVLSPSNATDGPTWARFRLSASGNLNPTGVAVGGEVEDYQVQIINIPLPTPQNDGFEVNEDTVLNTNLLSTPESSLFFNDVIPASTFLPVRFFVGVEPTNGTVVVTDSTSGRFTYTPLPDFYGTDTFTYRLSTQANAGAGAPTGVTFATVSINVRPVNDAPSATPKSFNTLEDTAITVTAAQLIAGSLADANAQFPVGSPASPWNEANQALNVISLQAGAIVITEANAGSGPFATARGTLQPRFDATTKFLIDVVYTPATDLNRNNFVGAGVGPLLDSFSFTLQDSGVLLSGVAPNNPLPGPFTPLTATSTVAIDVRPQNDPPILGTDAVSVGIVGTTSVTPWTTFFTNQGLPVRIPTEDATLTIPAAYLLSNDTSGRATAVDEVLFLNGNDNALTLTRVTAVTAGLLVSIDVSGNVTLVPPDDIYGEVVFTYEARDRGINEDLLGVRSPNSLTSIGTVTVTLQPINDPPVAFNRLISYVESGDAGPGVPFTFNAARLVSGVVGETPSIPGSFDPALPEPFSEVAQTPALRVVAFRTAAGVVSVSDLPSLSGTLTLASNAGGRFEFDFDNGAFKNGRFISAPDYNSRLPFAPQELLEFLIADDGRTPRPQGSGVAILPSVPAINFATITITVAQTNDAPVFNSLGLVNVLERDDSGETLVPNFVTSILPGPVTARDEQPPVQTVSFQIVEGATGSNVPAGLMRIPPVIDANGTLRVYPQPDAVGNAVYVFEAIDAEPGNASFVERRTRAMVTISVRPVNDAPRIDTAIAGSSRSQSVDEAWTVASDGTITFTMKEDNTGPLGLTSPYTINVQRDPSVVGYQRIGLLDVFTAGPANEEDSTQGGSQVLRLFGFQATTSLGGTIRAAAFDQAGNISQLEYIPPTDFNLTIGGLDSFTFTVQDDNPGEGETFNLVTGSLVPNRLTRVGTVQFRLNPINDMPRFGLAQTSVVVLEDVGAISFENFAINIFAGPQNTAFDEVDLNRGQSVSFAVTAVEGDAGMFAQPPTINDAGTLSFRTADNAFGTAVFEVRATDTGDDNATRGDIVSSSSRLITINIRPVNDRPTLNSTDPIVYTLNEDSLIDNGDGTASNFGTLIPLRGTGGQIGLLDVFNVGPANEAANIAPRPGGNQSLMLSTPFPAGTVEGGTLSQQLDTLGNLIGLRYTPRANFNGDDSFVYGVIDNGVSSDIDGNVTTDRREGFTTVSLRVLARNDAPTFGGASSVTVLEDAITTPTIGQTIIPNWATNIQAGPAVASDETNQRITFNVVAGAGNPTALFTVTPTVSENGTLSFTTSPNANGVAVFTVTASDNGGSNPPLDFDTSSPARTFSITVTAVNDAPTFTPGADVTVNEDSGQYSSPTKYATNISPGPADEVAAAQTVRFEVTVPNSGRALFLNGNTTGSGLPTISDDGFLRFTPADNVSGSVVVTAVAIDSAGARSAPASLAITIREVNDVPVANNDTFSGNEDTALVIIRAQIVGNDVDPDLASNSLEVLTIVDLPLTSLNGAAIRVGANGNIEYDPRSAVALQALAPGQTRSDTFTYRIQDAALSKSNLATVTVNVTGINDAPVLLPDNPTLAPTGSTIIRPLDNDTDIDGTIDPTSIRITLQPAFGSLRIEADGTLVYTPFPDFRGQDSLQYTVADNLGLRSAPQTITIDINQAPVAVNDIDGTFRDEAVNINVAANDFDPDAAGSLNLSSVEIVRSPARGTAVVAGGGIVRYLADVGFIGTDSFQYTIRDNNGRVSNVATVSVQTVGSRLQNPRLFTDVNASGETSPLDALLVINRISRAAQQGNPGSIPVLPTDQGPDFFDVDGSGFIAPLDALLVINQIARNNQTRLASGEGESAPTPQIRTSPVAATIADMVVTTFEDSDFQADFDSPIDKVVKAIAMSFEEDKEKPVSQIVAAIDAAWAEAGEL